MMETGSRFTHISEKGFTYSLTYLCRYSKTVTSTTESADAAQYYRPAQQITNDIISDRGQHKSI